MKITFGITIFQTVYSRHSPIGVMYKTIESDNVPTNNNEFVYFLEDGPSFGIEYIRRLYNEDRPCDVFVKLQDYKTASSNMFITKLREDGWREYGKN